MRRSWKPGTAGNQYGVLQICRSAWHIRLATLPFVYKDSGRSFNDRKIGAATFALGLREFRAGIEYATPEISSASLKSPRIVRGKALRW